MPIPDFDGVLIGFWKEGAIGEVRSDSGEKMRLEGALHVAKAAGNRNCWVGRVEETGKELSGEKRSGRGLVGRMIPREEARFQTSSRSRKALF